VDKPPFLPISLAHPPRKWLCERCSNSCAAIIMEPPSCLNIDLCVVLKMVRNHCMRRIARQHYWKDASIRKTAPVRTKFCKFLGFLKKSHIKDGIPYHISDISLILTNVRHISAIFCQSMNNFRPLTYQTNVMTKSCAIFGERRHYVCESLQPRLPSLCDDEISRPSLRRAK
jgi:hypothetical protein